MNSTKTKKVRKTESHVFNVGDVVRSLSNNGLYTIVAIDEKHGEYALMSTEHTNNYDWLVWEKFKLTEKGCVLERRPVICSNDKDEMKAYIAYRKNTKPFTLEEWRENGKPTE